MSNRSVPRVLIVDDEANVRELLTDALDAVDLEIIAAASGTEAIEIARRNKVDFVVADLNLGDCSGLDVLDQVRKTAGDVPAVVITGYGDAASFLEASRRRPVELMTKPLDVGRLRTTIREELTRRRNRGRWERRVHRLRRLAKSINEQRKSALQKLQTTCTDMTDAYRMLSGQMTVQQLVLSYQNDLLSARNDDDVFRSLFRLFVQRSGGLFGVALVCDDAAELQVVGRFGVPQPDGLRFCKAISEPVIDSVLVNPACLLFDATDRREKFDASIRRYLVGVNVLAIPLIPSEGQMIGLVVLYRKGEQPFENSDVVLAELIGIPTAIAIQRNG